MKNLKSHFNQFILFCVLIVSALFPVFAQQSSLEQEEKQARAEEIIKKYITAIGGKSHLNQIHSLTIKGQGKGTPYNMMLPMTVYVKNPGKNKVEISVMNQKLSWLPMGKCPGASTHFWAMDNPGKCLLLMKPQN